MLYEQNELIDYMYFIYNGSVKLFVDLNEFIANRPELEQLYKMGFEYNPPNNKCFIKYLEGGQIGENDIVAEMMNI